MSVPARRRRAARGVAGGVGMAVVAGLLVAIPAPTAAASVVSCAPEAADMAAAASMATECGVAVEDVSARTALSQTVFNPDGTVTVNQFAEPRWVRRGDGSWADVDTTLRVVDGVVLPVATAASMEFSAGGSGPLARLRSGDQQ